MDALEMFVGKEGSDITPIPESVYAALLRRDPSAFYRACVQTDFQPQDEEQREWYEIGRVLSGDAKKSQNAKREPKIDYARFGAALRRYGPSLDPFKDAYLKSIIYRQAGYTHLYGEDGGRIALDDASDARIGRAFEKTYAAYERWKRSNRR